MADKGFSSGDPVPEFYCPSTNNPNFCFSSVAGRYIVLGFYGSAAIPASAQAIAHLTGPLRRQFNDRKLSFFGVSIDPADKLQVRVAQMVPGIRYFWDFDRTVSRLYGAVEDGGAAPDGLERYRPFTLVLDPGLRVISKVMLDDPTNHNRRLQQIIAGLPVVDAYAEVPISAPVLIVPRVLDRAFCRQLIELYEAHGGRDSGSMSERDGYTVGKIDYRMKRRMDYEIVDPEVRSEMRAQLNRRLLPEIFKAFQFNATHIERYIVACYDGEHRGFFAPHRDNTTKATAHRRFACSINLNAEEYEGGELRFPEFGTRTYRAPTGGAVVFSCSLLHEATPVTSGRRYATLPFLYDEEGARLKVQNSRFLSGEVIDLNRQ